MMDAMYLQEKTALVTGGSGGIGQAVCQILLQHGARVVDASIEHEGAVLQQGNLFRIHTDVSRPESVAALFEWMDQRHLRPDILVNNAGIFTFKTLHEISDAEWRNLMAVNLDGVFFCSKAAIQRMLPRRQGLIIHIGSIAGQMALPGNAAYGVSKTAVHMLSQLINVEYAASGIKSAVLVLGGVATPIVASNDFFDPATMLQPETVAEAVWQLILLNTAGRAEELCLLPDYRFKP